MYLKINWTSKHFWLGCKKCLDGKVAIWKHEKQRHTYFVCLIYHTALVCVSHIFGGYLLLWVCEWKPQRGRRARFQVAFTFLHFVSIRVSKIFWWFSLSIVLYCSEYWHQCFKTHDIGLSSHKVASCSCVNEVVSSWHCQIVLPEK